MVNFRKVSVQLTVRYIVLVLLAIQIIFNPRNYLLIVSVICIIAGYICDAYKLRETHLNIQEYIGRISHYDRQEKRLKTEIQSLQREANFYRLIQRLFERTSGKDLESTIKAIIDALKVSLEGSIVFYLEKDFTGHYSLVDSSIPNPPVSRLEAVFGNKEFKTSLENKSSGTLTNINVDLGAWGTMHSAWVLPLISTTGNVWGAILIMYPMSDVSLEGMTEAWLFERNISMIIELATIHEAERGMAFKDPLTSAYNRNFMLTIIQNDINKAKNKGQNVYVSMFDIDNFKKFNDKYGHDAGDIVLKSIAREGRRKLRSTDYLVRYGGEEFIIILINTDSDNAYNCIERVRQAIANMVLSFDGEDVSVTCSFGLAQILPDKNLEETITMADKALYKAKAGGKNRTEVANKLEDEKGK